MIGPVNPRACEVCGQPVSPPWHTVDRPGGRTLEIGVVHPECCDHCKETT